MNHTPGGKLAIENQSMTEGRTYRLGRTGFWRSSLCDVPESIATNLSILLNRQAAISFQKRSVIIWTWAKAGDPVA